MVVIHTRESLLDTMSRSGLVEEGFFQACKNGNMYLLLFTIEQKVDINCKSGYGLRRAIR